MTGPGEPTATQAIDLMADHVVRTLVDSPLELGEMWEMWPEIGEVDWRLIEAKVRAKLGKPDPRWLAAYEVLEKRANGEEQP